MAQNTVIQPPPRLTGDPASDIKSLSDWYWAFYKGAVLESGLLDPAFQATAEPVFDPNNLPNPAATSIAKAQQTANEAYQIARTAIATANAAIAKAELLTQTFTLSNTSNQISVTFAAPRTDTNYTVLVMASDFSGAPVAEAFLVTRVAKTTLGFVITFDAAPGAGNSVTYDITVLPTFT